jgi:hypothetical protein
VLGTTGRDISVPAERVSGRDGRRDELRPPRIARAAPAAALAVSPARRHSAVATREVTAKQGAAHERGASAAGLAHLGRVADGARAPMRLLLALVPPRYDKHDHAVRGSHRDRTADDARCRAPLRTALASIVVAAPAKGVVVGVAATTRAAVAVAACAAVPSIVVLAQEDGNRWVDLLREVVNKLALTVVQTRGRDLNIGRQGLHHALRIRYDRQRRYVA